MQRIACTPLVVGLAPCYTAFVHIKQISPSVRKKTTAEWVEQAIAVHNGRYAYPDTIYAGANKKLHILCGEHGIFEQVANNHLRGTGCPKCGDFRKGESKVVGFSEFVSRVRKQHGDSYAYAEDSYSAMSAPVRITCPEHGAFEQIASVHAKGHGCPKCGAQKTGHATRLGSRRFIDSAVRVHGDRYDYSKVEYTRNSSKVEVICPDHGTFRVSPQNHLAGRKCPACAREQSKLGADAFIQRAQTIHGDAYDYSRVEYLTAETPVVMGCKEHGWFEQTPHSHLKGRGCPTCGIEARSSDTAEFVRKAVSVHGDRFDYGKAVYQHCEEKVEIVCQKHGSFFQTPSNHVSQQTGCPACANVGPSAPQIELATFLSSLTDVELEYRMGRKRIDIFLPKFNLGVEYHGLIWHSEKFAKEPWRDMLRHLEAEDNGIRLIHVFADEWSDKRQIVEQTLKSILGLNNKVGARTCNIVRPAWGAAKVFLDANHLQGAGVSRGMNYALESEGEIVAVAVFGPSRFGTGDWELLRFASSCNVIGGFSRLLKAFRSEYAGSVFSFSDNRWFTGNVYATAGFRKLGVTDPGYFWTDGSRRLLRYDTQKHKLKTLFADCDPDTQTESQIMQSRGFYRIWDCGNTRWLLE